MMTRRGTNRLCPVFLLCVLTFAANVHADPSPARVTFVDGKSEQVVWMGLTANGAFQFTSPGSSTPKVVSADSVMAVDFEHDPSESPGRVVFHLADGGSLTGELVSGSSESVVAATVIGEQTKLPFERLAAVQLTAKSKFELAGELFQEALSSRLPGQDVLVTKSVEDAKALRGRLESLAGVGNESDESGGALKGVFNIGGRSRTFALPKVYGIVFAAGAAALPSFGATISLTDGSKFRGWVEGGTEKSVRCKASFDTVFDVPVDIIKRIEIHSDRVIWLSDLMPVAEESAGLLSKPWPWMRDRSVGGQPLSVDGKMYPKGIGVRAKSELTFDVDGKYACFATTLGIDDSVRPRGNVVFSVVGDEKVLWESGAVSGRERAKDAAVDISGVKKLALRVDYGDDLDLSDHADWCASRLLKKNPDGSHPCTAP